MRARLMKEQDVPSLKLLLGERTGLDFKRDVVIVVPDADGNIVGALAARNMFLVHEFAIVPGTMARHVGDVMFNYAFALGQARIQNPNGDPEAMFIVDKDNPSMQKFVERYGAKREDENGKVYILELS